jgi:ankyrin repeat protein
MTREQSVRPLLAVIFIIAALHGCKDQPVETVSLHDQLLAAAQLGNLPEVKLLLAHGLDKKSLNEAVFATIQDQPMKLYVDSGTGKWTRPSPASSDFSSDPYAQIIGLLLDKGADLNARDDDQSTPLSTAAGYGRLSTVEILLARGADMEARDNYGNTALLDAACDCAEATMPDTYDVVKLLLEQGANINATTNTGNTPLMIASGGGVVKTQIVKLLIEKGANLQLKNNKGDTALSIASQSGVPEVVTLLKRAAAQSH